MSYGNSWWGKQWLNALTNIDYDNRLPRGRTYANKGAVKNLTLKGGTLQAKVLGSRPLPYQVLIQVPSLIQKYVDRLLDALVDDPSVIARLLNRELDPSVLEQANRLGIAIFPSQWKDLTMRCSCPDWAVPCKHLAATIYLISRQIDSNPFLVFSLRGVDLIQQLKARGINIEHEVVVSVPRLSALLMEDEASAEANLPDPMALEMLAYADLPSLSEPLLSVLPTQTVFFPDGDLRKVMQRVLTRVAKFARKVLDGKILMDMPTVTLLASHCPRITLSREGDAIISGVNGLYSIEELDTALAQLTPADLPDRQPEVAALFHLRMISLHLLAHGAVVPQVFSVAPDVLGVRWLPAMLDNRVAEQMELLARGLPSQLAVLSRNQTISPIMQACALCAVFLGYYLRMESDYVWEKPRDNKILSLLFSGEPKSFDGPEESAIGPALQTWFARYHLAERDYSLVLSLDEGAFGDFEVGLAIQPKSALLTPPVPLHSVLTEQEWSQTRFGILQTVVLLAEFFPPLNDYLRQGARSPIVLTAEQLPELLFNTLPVIQLLGIRTLLPKLLERLLRPRLSMNVSSRAQGLGSNQLRVDEILTFDWRIALGEHYLTHTEFEQLVQGATGIVRFKGEYVYLDPEEIASLQAQLDRPSKLSGTELLRTALAGEYGGTPVKLDDNTLQLLTELRESGEVPLPCNLNATLRPYQQRGYAWMLRNLQVGFGSVIADDMGLGKTLQVIATLLKLKQDGALEQSKALIVVPTSLLTNWQREIARFAPTISIDVFHGSKRELACERPDVLLTTYGIVRSAVTTLKVMSWRVLVVDEAQNIKNPSSAQTKAIKSIPAAGYIAMSGTPVENRLSEYWSLMDFVNRGYLGTLKRFEKDYTTPIQINRDRQVAERFQRITAPFLLRRLKSDHNVISDLPDKVECDQYCTLTATQTALYESVVREGLLTLEAEEDQFKRQGLVLQMILALKQICNHPDLYLKQPASDAMTSGKLGRLFDLLDDIHARHEKTLIFTQFREMGELLAHWLRQRYGQSPMFLHGGLSRSKRDEMVEKFQTDRTERVFLLSLKAGGTGLNLTAASNVIHFDLWWNPAVEAQATDRAYRIGQRRNVQVHRFITSATFEERINEMIQRKRELADMVVGSGEQWIGNLDTQALRELFALA
ncbi:DEAD/DEAH box helicase [Xenorhabdus thuongxuanensis]|uniref:ATP-dependent helicase HepA n=1 Tax=Xenorhabdus thuongxuanensis TaxID=1873484 RepID=A0A1Q5U6I6_9GAMM|nr:DEAD/DEAH box helicase [Xenorhabdus thuongxuanensis]OKP08070.1 ATP-dependent helicase HepA [Xenorhabdus thuongxuanensis]